MYQNCLAHEIRYTHEHLTNTTSVKFPVWNVKVSVWHSCILFELLFLNHKNVNLCSCLTCIYSETSKQSFSLVFYFISIKVILDVFIQSMWKIKEVYLHLYSFRNFTVYCSFHLSAENKPINIIFQPSGRLTKKKPKINSSILLF